MQRDPFSLHMRPLTHRQKQALDFIRESTARHGYAPTLREIGAHLGIKSTNAVNDHLRALVRKGWLERGRSATARTLVLVGEAPLEVPKSERFLIFDHVGEDEHPLLTMRRPSCAGEADFGVVMPTTSLTSIGILKGDWLFVAAGRSPRERDLALLASDTREPVVRVCTGDAFACFEADPPAVPSYIFCEDIDRAVLGVVVGMLRPTLTRAA